MALKHRAGEGLLVVMHVGFCATVASAELARFREAAVSEVSI